jgi:hypothetical protein
MKGECMKTKEEIIEEIEAIDKKLDDRDFVLFWDNLSTRKEAIEWVLES